MADEQAKRARGDAAPAGAQAQVVPQPWPSAASLYEQGLESKVRAPSPPPPMLLACSRQVQRARDAG